MLSFLLSLHRSDAYAAIILMLAAAIYGFIAYRRNPTHVPYGYKALLIGGGIVLAVQPVIGIAMLLQGLRPSDMLHIFIYGALSPLVLPGAWLYTRGRGRRHPNLAFALVSVFLFGFLIRALFTT